MIKMSPEPAPYPVWVLEMKWKPALLYLERTRMDPMKGPDIQDAPK